MVPVHFFLPPEIDCKAQLPSRWDDLDDKELFFIANALLCQSPENQHETRALILEYIIGHRVKGLPVNWMHLINPELFVLEVYPIINFIFDENNRTVSPTIHGIQYTFQDMTCGEFEDCEIASFNFSEANDPQYLVEIVAILFREKGKAYMKYNARTNSYLTYQYHSKIKQYQSLTPAQLYSVFIWYAGNKNQLPGFFPDLYNSKKKSTSAPDPMIFTNVIHAGAGPKNGSRNEIRCSKLFEFLYDCNQEAKKAAELEAQYNSMK